MAQAITPPVLTVTPSAPFVSGRPLERARGWPEDAALGAMPG
jgi:hypothetical protein